jgi:carboxylesterase type B
VQNATTTTLSLQPVTLDYNSIIAAAANNTVGYYKYQNIRFAAVPTGTLRWDKPQWRPFETAANHGSLAASDIDCASGEDCLYMDIWAPANSENKSLHVTVWTYGGGFTGGSESQNTPEGLFDLSTDFVFVAYNYGLGMTGLANGPTLLHGEGKLNVAFWDVQHAFEWTKKYISAFGGSPEKITAIGFSASEPQTLFQLI